MRKLWSTVMAVLCVALSAGPALADEGGVETIVGRADADASGDWPVLLWVLNGETSHVVVRAPREQLATLPGQPWERLDAGPLIGLEHYGAPRLIGGVTYDPCWLKLQWEQVFDVVTDRQPQERLALAHRSCGAAACGQDAWRLQLPRGTGSTLPLRQLMPWLASHREAWLVLYVISPDERVAVAGLPQLTVPERLGGTGTRKYNSDPTVPAEVAAQFPAVHTAMLTHAAAQQGLAHASAVMRVDSLSTVDYLRFARNWEGTPAQRQALGVTDPAMRWHRIVRLLLRLDPADRPATLTLQPVERNAAYTFMDWHAYIVEPVSIDSCRRRIEAMDCEVACAKRIGELRKSWSSRYGFRGEASATPTADLMTACVPACRKQMSDTSQTLVPRFEEAAQGQNHVWRQLEFLTGLPPSTWRLH